MEVIIDGIRYIPAKNVIANRMNIAKGLLMQFWGVCDDKQANELINDGELGVIVTDDTSMGGISLKEALDNIAEES